MRLVRKGDLVLEYKAKDRKQIKTEKWYRVNQEGLKELQPSGRAKKRLALKERLLLEQGEQPLAGLYQDFSREVVAYFIEQGVLEITEREVNRAAAYYEGKEQTQALLLNSEQAKAVETVVSQIGKTSKPFLLEGVTGSGKTEVYLQIIQEVLNKGENGYYVGS